MPNVFPGMDPYLEHPGLWPDVHNSLIAAIRGKLAPLLKPRYVVRLEERTYLAEPSDSMGLVFVGRPDLSVRRREKDEGVREPTPGYGRALAVEVPLPDRVRETWLEVRVPGNREVVTVLEVLSPSNKSPAGGEGRSLYEKKRMTILGSSTHLVEVDLIRLGEPMPVFGATPLADYRILVSRGDRRPRADLFLFGVRDPIPRFRLPLLSPEEEPEVDLGAVVHALYDEAAYDLSIDYRMDPVPPLTEGSAEFADQLLRRAGKR